MKYIVLNCKQLRACNCRQNFAILSLLIAALALLFGCTQTVPQEKYDSLAAACAQQNATLQAGLSNAQAALAGAQGSLSDCVAGKQAQDQLIADKDNEIALLHLDSDVLAHARQKTTAIEDYNNLTSYYNDAYGPGKIINTAKLNRIDAQVRMLNDSSLSSSWADLRGCQTSYSCDVAKTAFVATIKSNIALLDAQVAAIVAQ